MKKIAVTKSKIHGEGIIALEDIKKGERIQYIRGPIVHKKIKNGQDSLQTMHWIGVGKSLWIKTEGMFLSINHSCSPNAVVTGKRTVVALKNIEAGEEITMDYSLTDSDPLWTLRCNCGAKNCRKHIGAIYTIPPELFKKYTPYTSKYFQRTYTRNQLRGSHRVSAR